MSKHSYLAPRSACVVIAAVVACGSALSARQVGPPTPKPATQQQLPTLAAPTSSDRILVVAPHPDDETIGAGGFLDEAAKAGAAIRIVVATDGNKHGLKLIRYQEIAHAVQKLGVAPDDITFFNYPDGHLSKQADFQRRLDAISDQFHPTIVIGTHPMDYHPDHAAVGRAIQSLGERDGHGLRVYFFVVHYHRYPLPDAYRPDVALPPPPRIKDSISQWETFPLNLQDEQAKCAAVLEYHSQILKRNPLRRGLLISFIRKNEIFAVRSY